MTKEEAIKSAYGDAFESLEPYIDVNGWVRASNLHLYPKAQLPFKSETIVMDGRDWYRPKELSGINDNNGWTKINSRDDLPKEEGAYLIYGRDGRQHRIYFHPDISYGGWMHWRPIPEIPNPNY